MYRARLERCREVVEGRRSSEMVGGEPVGGVMLLRRCSGGGQIEGVVVSSEAR